MNLTCATVPGTWSTLLAQPRLRQATNWPFKGIGSYHVKGASPELEPQATNRSQILSAHCCDTFPFLHPLCQPYSACAEKQQYQGQTGGDLLTLSPAVKGPWSEETCVPFMAICVPSMETCVPSVGTCVPPPTCFRLRLFGSTARGSGAAPGPSAPGAAPSALPLQRAPCARTLCAISMPSACHRLLICFPAT